MSADTATAGYPPHRVVTFRRWTNPHGAKFTSWEAACGDRGNESGHGPFGRAGSARERELCADCWPTGMRGHYPRPTDLTPGAAA